MGHLIWGKFRIQNPFISWHAVGRSSPQLQQPAASLKLLYRVDQNPPNPQIIFLKQVLSISIPLEINGLRPFSSKLCSPPPPWFLWP